MSCADGNAAAAGAFGEIVAARTNRAGGLTTGAKVHRPILGAAAGMLLSARCVFAATPEELYQTWQDDSLHRPETAESAAEDYLRAAPTGPHAQELQLWLDAYRRAMANILAGAARHAGAPKTRQASAQPPVPKEMPATSAPPAAPPELQKWLDAYHRTVASLVAGASQFVAQSGTRFASAEPAPPKQIAPPPAPAPKVAAQPAPQSVPAAAPVVPQPAPPPASSQPVPPPAQLATSQPAPQPVAPQTPQPQDSDVQTRQPPKAPENPGMKGQSLTQALAFIADRMEREGRITVLAQFHDAAGDRDLVKQLSYQARGVTIDPGRCQLSFRGQMAEDGQQSATHTVALRLAKDVTVETIDQALTDSNMRGGHPFPVHTDPAAYAVHIGGWGSAAGDDLYFRDKTMAAQVGESMQHALELCDEEPGRQSRTH